jgi:hypothetical protein
MTDPLFNFSIPEDEALELRKFILMNETYWKSLGPDLFYQTAPDSLHGRWRYFNLFQYPVVRRILSEPIVAALEHFSITDFWIQSWAGTYRKNEGIDWHIHHHLPEQGFTGNIFLGADIPTQTLYRIDNQVRPIDNKLGDITMFPMNIPHSVGDFQGEDIRVIIAFDILRFKGEDGIWIPKQDILNF